MMRREIQGMEGVGEGMPESAEDLWFQLSFRLKKRSTTHMNLHIEFFPEARGGD